MSTTTIGSFDAVLFEGFYPGPAGIEFTSGVIWISTRAHRSTRRTTVDVEGSTDGGETWETLAVLDVSPGAQRTRHVNVRRPMLVRVRVDGLGDGSFLLKLEANP